jgi:hypothetical protein
LPAYLGAVVGVKVAGTVGLWQGAASYPLPGIHI